MNIGPALRKQRLLIAIFISVMLFVLFGSIYYKYSYINQNDANQQDFQPSDGQESADIYQEITNDLQPVRPQVNLSLVPLDTSVANQIQYRILIDGVGSAVTGISLKLLPTDHNQNISFSSVQISEAVNTGPWQVLINKSILDSNLNVPSLEFALSSTDLKNSTIDPAIDLGIITVTGIDGTEDIIVAEDSLVVVNGEPYEIVLESTGVTN